MMMARRFQIAKLYKPQTSNGWADYELIDSGSRKKLERFGAYNLIRFEPDAIWKPSLDKEVWAQADAEYIINPRKNAGQWKIKPDTSKEWVIRVDEITAALKISKSRHVGIFPEQIENWRWVANRIRKSEGAIKVLNLFAYTGISSLFCANAGAHVTHVDASRSAIEMGKVSAQRSNLNTKSIRWILDDVIKFIQRENRRGNKYDAIIMDPPKFGRGPKGELWKFEDSIDDLLSLCKQLLSDYPLFFLLTAYNIGIGEEKLADLFTRIFNPKTGKIEYGPLIQQEKSASRKINQAIYMRWSNR